MRRVELAELIRATTARPTTARAFRGLGARLKVASSDRP